MGPDTVHKTWMEECMTHTMVRAQNPAPDMVTIIEGQGMACIAPWQMYDVRFVNDGPFPVKLYWSRTSRNDLGVWTRAVQGPSVAIGTGGSTTLPNFCIDGDLEVLAVPASSASPAPTWDGDWATQVPDGLYIYSPASDPVNKAFNITKPPYTFTFTLDGKITPGQKVIDQPPTTMATLTLQQPRVLCGDWIEVPGGDVIMGIPVTHVTGFRAYPEACAAYCAGNPTLCDDAKLTACGVQKGLSVWGATSPECACLLGSASEVALPSTAGLTYTKFKNFLATLPGLTFPPMCAGTLAASRTVPCTPPRPWDPSPTTFAPKTYRHVLRTSATWTWTRHQTTKSPWGTTVARAAPHPSLRCRQGRLDPDPDLRDLDPHHNENPFLLESQTGFQLPSLTTVGSGS